MIPEVDCCQPSLAARCVCCMCVLSCEAVLFLWLGYFILVEPSLAAHLGGQQNASMLSNL